MIRIGVLGTANIAERRMIPAIKKSREFTYVCVAIAVKEETGMKCSDEEFAPVMQRKLEKAEHFVEMFGGEYCVGYEAMLQREDIDAVYLPLPPALHFQWAMKALEYGKHLLVEKPFTISAADTARVVAEAKKRGLSVIENYGFVYHKQMDLIRQAIDAGRIGELRLIRASFGFPHRQQDDFRYCRKLGGGALLDCGGYTLKIASEFLGDNVSVVEAASTVTDGHEVDVFGSATLRDQAGICAQVAYGMDNFYKCELEVWGSTGYISAPRIFTAPGGFAAPVMIRTADKTEELTAEDDQFERIVDRLGECIASVEIREKSYQEILTQSILVDRCR